MNISFRHLKSDEIECRIASCGNWGVQLLLYKNARVDMALLDEAVGALNWGIGRELYSAPVMFISANHLKTLRNENWKWKCNDIFKVTNIQYNNNAISYVQIINCKTNEYIEFWN